MKKITTLLSALALTAFGWQANAQVLSEGFNGGAIPLGWTQEYESGTEDWATATTNGNGSITPNTGAGMVQFITSASGDVTKLVTPSLNLTTLTTPQLTLYYANVSWFGDIDELRIFYKTSAAGAWVQIGTDYIAEQTSWTEVVLTLPNPSNDYYLAFEGTSSWARGLDLDDILVDEAPACVAPTTLTVANITTTSADLGWTSAAATWDIEYGVAPYTATGTPTITGTTTNPHNLSGLTSATSYQFYVRADCGGSGVSTWEGPFTFSTTPDYCAGDHFYDNGGAAGDYSNSVSNETTVICPASAGDVVTATFNSFDTEANYDDLTIYDGNGIGGTSFGTFDGTTIPGPFMSTDVTGCLTFVFNSDGSGIRAGWDATITCAPAPTCLVPTALTAANITAYTADLGWTSAASTWDIESGVAGFTPTGTPTTTGTTNNPHNISGLAPVTSYDFYVRADCGAGDLSTWAGPFNFTTTISCVAPTALTASNMMTTSADLGWTSTASAWDIEWDVAGFTATGTPTITGTTTNPNNLTGLTANTAYDFYVRADCGAADGVSIWAGPFSFTTPCDAVLAPFVESFDGTTIPSCWSESAVAGGPWEFAGSAGWGAASFVDNTGNSGNFAWIDFSGTNDTAVVLQVVDVDVSALTTPELTFALASYNTDDTDSNELYVEAWDGSAWAQLAVITQDSSLWMNHSYSLASYTFGANLTRVRFRAERDSNGTTFYTNDLLIDDVKIDEAIITCDVPTTLTVANITNTSADLGWTSTATTWDIELGAAGFTTTGTPTTVGTTTNPTNITGLTGGAAYDFYVRADCGAVDGVSTWAGPFNFTTTTVGIDENAKNLGLSIYPNPNNGIFTLNVKAQNVLVNIMNTQGQVIFSKNNVNTNEQIDLSNNAKGIYFVTVTSNEAVTTQKVIVR